MTLNLNRRLFLRGFGGAAVAAPFLGSVVERSAKAQGLVASGTPKRLIVQFTHYGCLTDLWFPKTAHGALTGADYMGTSLESLAPFAGKILQPRGIRAMNEWRARVTHGQGNDPHTQVTGSYFTCVPVTPHNKGAFEFNDAKTNAKPIDRSLDHVCAEQLSPGGVPLFMRVSGRRDNEMSAISYSGPEEQFPGLDDPSQVYSNLTGLFSEGGGGEQMTPDTYQALKGKSIIDLVRGDLTTLQGIDMSKSDKEKLEAWMALLEDTGKSVMSAAQCNAEKAMDLSLTNANFSAGGGFGSDYSEEIDGVIDGADLFANLAVLATVCDANPVIFLKHPGNYNLGGIGVNSENHGLSHRIGDAGMGGSCVDGVNADLEKIDRFNAEKFAHLIGQLDAIPEGDGTILDNTAAVWFQEVSDGNAHNLNNMPIIHAGGCGGYFKTGQAVNVDDGDPDLSRGNSVGPCANPGGTVTGKSTETPEEFGNAPINKYFCNLMNAIGVKGGADGFPAADGTGEVTHYGMYDDTTDFASGGDNPASINDPGEYTELKA